MTGKKEDGGSAFPCSRCGEAATHKQGNQRLCPKHYRFGQMRATANRRGLAVPSHQHLEQLAARGMQCPDCDALMNWLGRDGQTHVASLQHYRDGTFGLVCQSCNTRHAFAPGDSYRENPPDTKHCPSCKEFKPLSSFSKDNSRKGQMKIKSTCKSCSALAHANWEQQKADAMLKERARS